MAERRPSVSERIAFFQGKKSKKTPSRKRTGRGRKTKKKDPEAESSAPAKDTSDMEEARSGVERDAMTNDRVARKHSAIKTRARSKKIGKKELEPSTEGTSTKVARSLPRGKIFYEDVDIAYYRKRKVSALQNGAAQSFNVPGNVNLGLRLVSLSDNETGKEGVCVKEVRKDGYLSGKIQLHESFLSHINGYPVTEYSFKEVLDALLRKHPKVITFRIPPGEYVVAKDDFASSEFSTNCTVAASKSMDDKLEKDCKALDDSRSEFTRKGYAASLDFMRSIVKLIPKPTRLDDLAAVDRFANRLQRISSIFAVPNLTLPTDVRIETLVHPPQAEVYYPNCSSSLDTSHTLSKSIPTLLYCHGGGYALMSPKTHRYYLGQLASTAKIQIVAIDYRKPPQNPYPAAVFDVVDAYRFLIGTVGLRPCQIVFGGDSAGGGLCVASLVALRDMRVALPAAGVLLSPWVDLNDVRRESWKDNAGYDFITPDFAQILAKVYAGKHSLKAPGVSPIRADLKGLPPLLMEIGDRECFRDMGLEFAKKARGDGVEVDMEVRDEMAHVFALWAKLGSVSGAAFDHVCSFIERHVEKTPT